MPRSTPEWIGKTDDAAVPPRVRLRVLEKNNRCCKGCGQSLHGRPWTCDHIIALVNGGENRETNLQPLGTRCCNPAKNRSDVAEKSKSYDKRLANAGIKRAKGRPIMGSKASGWRKRMDGTVERR